MPTWMASRLLRKCLRKIGPLELSISLVDLLIVIAYMFGAVVFGLWIGRGQRDTTDYLLGGRDLPWWTILGSIVATETSTVTFLSVPGIAFAEGGNFQFIQLAFGYIIGRLVVVLVFLPDYFRGTLFTAYQVLDRRFGGGVKQTASILFIIMRNLADGMRLYLTAIVLTHVVGLSLEICVFSIGMVTIIYTLFGGMKAVVWNDCIQFLVYMCGAILAGSVILSHLPGGWAQLWTYGDEHHKWTVFNFSGDLTQTYTFWSGLIGGLFLTLGTHGTDQLMVQRYLCARNQPDAARALATSGGIILLQFALFLLLGVGLACFYSIHPAESELAPDEVFASFIVNHMPIGVVGLTLAAVFSAAMSTLSSSLNSSATAAVNDLYVPLLKADVGTKQSLNMSRVLTVVFGVLQMCVGIAAHIGIAGQYVNPSVVGNVLAIAGFTMSIILGVFCLGVFSPQADRRSALTAIWGGLFVMSGVAFGTNLAWPWFTVLGAMITFSIGSVAAHYFNRPLENEAKADISY